MGLSQGTVETCDPCAAEPLAEGRLPAQPVGLSCACSGARGRREAAEASCAQARVCACVHRRVCVRVCIGVWVCMCAQARTCVCTGVWVCVCAHSCRESCLCAVHVFVRMCTRAGVSVSTRAGVSVCTCAGVHTRACTHRCVFVVPTVTVPKHSSGRGSCPLRRLALPDPL